MECKKYPQKMRINFRPFGILLQVNVGYKSSVLGSLTIKIDWWQPSHWWQAAQNVFSCVEWSSFLGYYSIKFGNYSSLCQDLSKSKKKKNGIVSGYYYVKSRILLRFCRIQIMQFSTKKQQKSCSGIQFNGFYEKYITIGIFVRRPEHLNKFGAV